MVKLLLLSLLFGLVYADLKYQNTGSWKLVKSGATNRENFSGMYPPKFHVWSIYCDTIDCRTLLINSYVKVVHIFDIFEGDVCRTFSSVAVKDKDSDTFNFYYHGFWNFDFCYQSQNSLVICEKNTDLKGDVTYFVELMVRPDHELTEEENEEFEKWLTKYNIPESNVLVIKQEERCVY